MLSVEVNLEVTRTQFTMSHSEFLMGGGLEADMAGAVCGGRRFGRKFRKRDYPILGEDDEVSEDDKTIAIGRLAKERLPKKLSTTVAAIRDLCLDPKTGKWHWPQNGADMVYTNLYLGDE